LNETLRKFGYPKTQLAIFKNWVLLARPAQVTVGSLILGALSDATSWSELEPRAFMELHDVIGRTEAALRRGLGAEKINYLMLMMVDPYVHFHVIPRYATAQALGGAEIDDAGWPGPPRLDTAVELTDAMLFELKDRLSGYFERGAALG